MKVIESGNVAAALGVKLCRANVIAAYPITPQTPLTEKLSEFVESGQMKAEYIPVESEHSALGVCIAASSTGARAFTATSANGLLYMHEQLHWAAGARLPIVMCVANRGVGAPWTVWNDQQDSLSQRDTGWIQLYAADHQEIIDSVIKAFYVAERTSIPVMVCYDGYILSHTHMPFEVPDQEKVDAFLPPFRPGYALDPDKPANLNTVTLPETRNNIRGETAHGYMELRYLLHEDMRNAIDVVGEAGQRFNDVFSSSGTAYLDMYKCDDATFVAVAMGSLSLHLRVVADILRDEGIKLGIMDLKLYRPFPDKVMADALKGKEGVIVMEKAISYGYAGPLYSDICSALYTHAMDESLGDLPFIYNYILGLGGRAIRTTDLVDAIRPICTGGAAKDQPAWIGLKL